MSYSIIDRDVGPDPNYKPPPKGMYRGKYEECYSFYEAYNKCHKENKVSRLLGACSPQKSAVDKCNQEQLHRRRREGAEKARIKNAKWNEYYNAKRKKEMVIETKKE
eukprot:jgi/Bigna1/91213/estExt_fgenesh1_pg.C_930014